MTGWAGLGSSAHRTVIGRVVAHYQADSRVRSVAVFGSVSAGTWHELSDVNLDIVIEDDARVVPADEIAALFGARAAIALTRDDAADVVLDSPEEVSVRWHSLQTTSPNITATARVVAGRLSGQDLRAAGEANRAGPDVERLLDTVVRDAIGARKALLRGGAWEAAVAVERVRASLTALRGRRDRLRLDPSRPAQALAAVLAETQASYDLGPGGCSAPPSSRPGSLTAALEGVPDDIRVSGGLTAGHGRARARQPRRQPITAIPSGTSSQREATPAVRMPTSVGSPWST